MGLHDRPYWKEQEHPGGWGGPGGPMGGMRIGLPKPGPVIKWLLIVNFAVFVAQIFADQSTDRYPFGFLSTWFGATRGGYWQVWRYVTCQFLHGGYWHIILNMLGLYMLGTPLEQRFGTRRFLTFYLSCGIAGALAYVLMGAAVRLDPAIPIIGASGGVYAVVLACAVLFPHFRIIFLFFPVPIRLAALIIFGGMVLLILQSISSGQFRGQFWSDVAHMGGALAGAVWIWGVPKFALAAGHARQNLRRGAWERKLQRRADQEAEVNRILDKVRDEGLDRLTRKEKKALQDATRRQREEERR